MINHYLDKANVSSLSLAANWQREVLLPKFFCSRAALLTTLRHSATGSRTRAHARQELT